MRFINTNIDGLWIIEPERVVDSRGSFARTFCSDEYAKRGLETRYVQHSESISHSRFTLRGLHYQEPPHAEVKIVSCCRGEIFDVAVDLRPESRTFMQWRSVVLSGANGTLFYIPQGFAHGFQALTNDVAVRYMMSAAFEPSSSKGIRYDDPAIGIEWPEPPTVISERDLSWPLMKCYSDLATAQA
ncbi:dTDP-4-dehydrorhamnose 3,5-epimerase [Pseudorhizobium endolithicum]|uniref:dTDP-4-dehydrorhamnose 3,5-epimerase n=1 Tax=Pseudorhizobium endolithicum TaxID=1191678 RepID=A0ABM8PRF1_9HYPH|nr:dTDP-4-dehydrorhamnose 3,5-epimerase [Pseudorhizobium endolithicum]CAD7044400.1 dTDP-4-dehydrorhamnose 3,5-epimerase [Pseudorhizobium endolithicum]